MKLKNRLSKEKISLEHLINKLVKGKKSLLDSTNNIQEIMDEMRNSLTPK